MSSNAGDKSCHEPLFFFRSVRPGYNSFRTTPSTQGLRFRFFATPILPSSFVWLTRHLLKPRNGSRGVVRLCLHSSTGQVNTSFPAVHRLAFFHSFAAVKSEQNGHATLLAANAEIPPRVGSGPWRNIQRVSLPSETPQLWLSQGGMGLTPMCFIIRSIKRCDTDETHCTQQAS